LTVSASGSGATPGGSTVHPFGTSDLAGPVVNELLVQMQSFEVPVGWRRVAGWLVRAVNVFLPAGKHLTVPAAEPANILVIAATNRADGLDPALLRPGRFDRRLTFELPGKAGRRELVDHFLTRKSHSRKLDDPQFRDALAAVTTGYSPAMVEGLLDEALIGAVRRGRTRMGWKDVESARLAMEVGIGQPFTYTDHERQLVATHEAGHAVIAWLVAPQRRLEVLSIIKRRSSLGLLAHGDRDDVFTRSSSELRALIQIAMGGQSAEELFFGDVSTGPAGDLAYATQVAAQMVGSAGMDSSLVSFEAITAGAFGGTNLVGRVLGDSAGRTAVERLLAEQKAVARNLLDSNRYLVEALRDALIERSELVGPEITKVLEQAAASAPVMSVPALAEPESATMPVQASASVIDLRDSLPGRTHPNA
jgi:ATP-dependent Zn protease